MINIDIFIFLLELSGCDSNGDLNAATDVYYYCSHKI